MAAFGETYPLAEIRRLAESVRRVPEPGRRTTPSDIQRWRSRRRLVDLDLSDVTGILHRAEDGDVRDACDLWHRMLRSDDHLGSVWESRTAPIYSAPMALEAGVSSELAADMLREACAEALARIENVAEVNAHLLHALGTGFAAAEKLWRRDYLLGVPAWVPCVVMPIQDRRFRYSDEFELGLYDDGFAVAKLERAGFDVERLPVSGMPLAALPKHKYMVHQPVGGTGGPASSLGLTHQVARPWWVKNVAMRVWLAGAETSGIPRMIAEILQNADSGTMDELFEQLERLAADGVAVVREGAKVTVIEPKAQASSDIFDTLVMRCEAGMSKLLLGSTINVEISSAGGNRATAESQGRRTIDPRQEADQTQLCQTWRRGFFRDIRDLNPHLFPARTPLPVASAILSEDTAEIDKDALEAGVVTVDEWRRSRGLRPLGGMRGAQMVQQQRPASAQVPSTAPVESKDAAADADVDDAKDEAAATKAQAEAKVSLDLAGIQTTTIKEILDDVATKRLPKGTAVELLVVAFPSRDRGAFEALLDSLDGHEAPAEEPLEVP